jgi:hypothetical protein
MDLLTSDPGILVMCGVGLVATAISIVRDTRTQRAHAMPTPMVAEPFVADQLRDAA